MKVILEKNKCINCGSCVSVCPDHFELEESGKASLKNSKKEEDNEVIEIEEAGCCQDAADVCPVQCIHVKE